MTDFVSLYGERAALFLDIVFRGEGGYANHKLDKGGQTMRGVTFAVFMENLRMLGLQFNTEQQARAYHSTLPIEDAAEIYIKRFWLASGMNTLPAPELGPWAPLAISVADHKVNTGVYGVIGLQRLIGAKEDGVFGPVSLRMTLAKDPSDLFVRYQEWRRQYYKQVTFSDMTPAELKLWHETDGKGLQNLMSNLARELKTKGLKK